MSFRTHIDNIREIVETGTRVKLLLKNGTVLEGPVGSFQLIDNYVYYIHKER